MSTMYPLIYVLGFIVEQSSVFGVLQSISVLLLLLAHGVSFIIYASLNILFRNTVTRHFKKAFNKLKLFC